MNMRLMKRFYIGLGFGLLVLYAITRTVNLTALPIFTDEAIYIRWSQIGSQDANWRFISLTDGKQPLFTWIMMVTLRLFQDPLVAGRMVSVGAGIFSLVGLGVLAQEIFGSKKISFLTGFLYIISPFSVMYDRLAIYDSLSAALAIWNLYLAILLVKKIRLDIALIFGLLLGVGMLNKTSGFIAIYLLPSTLLLFNFKQFQWKKKILQWMGYATISFILSQIVYGILRLSPFYHMVSQKDFVFVHPFKNWYFLYPFFLGNMQGLFDWITGYLTWPIFLLALSSVFILLRSSQKRISTLLSSILLLIYCFVPLTALAYFGKVLYPRFILFMALPLLILAAFSFNALMEKFWKRWYVIAFSFIFLFQSIWTTYFIVTNPTYAPIPNSDRGQLIDDWPSGYGAKESITFLSKEVEKGQIAVYTEGTFGLFPYALEIYLVKNPNISIKGLWPLPKDIPSEMLESASKKPTFFILNQTQVVPPGWPLELIAEYQKGTNKSVKLRLYRVIQPYVI